MNTQEQKRIKIAEACGWTQCRWNGAYDTLKGVPPVRPSVFRDIPDYFNDLNAMHEAEKVLIQRGGLPSYEHFLRLNEFTEDNEPWYGSIHATAAQRAEAFGLTLKLW